MDKWKDRDKWASASVVPPLIMIAIGVYLWPVGISALVVGVYLIAIIGKAQKEQAKAIREGK